VAKDIELRNLKETQKAFDQMVKDLRGPPMINAMRDATLVVTRAARKNAPTDAGHLRASIVPEVRRGGFFGNLVEGVVGSNKEYAPYVETGTEPHWPPPGALILWVRRKLRPRFMATSAARVRSMRRQWDYESFRTEFLIRRAISERGTKAHPYLEPAVKTSAERVTRILERGVQKAIGAK
jgi:HK97 gp10 family phage protein